jgi:hypothetical protein
VLQDAVYQLIPNSEQAIFNIPYLPLFRFQAQEKNAPYPPLGPKESKGNKREFTKEQLEAGKNIVAMRF